jgi:hypothetical protein
MKNFNEPQRIGLIRSKQTSAIKNLPSILFNKLLTD